MDLKQSINEISESSKLRRPIQIVKKRSGPLDSALDEVNNAENNDKISSSNTTTTISLQKQTTVVPHERRKQSTKDKDKKRERWLLTRKTWKYMTDAGKKLIPENDQNRKEDIHKIEEHFNKVCANEPRFILWRRKGSFPGASRTTKSRYKLLRQHTGLEPKYQQNLAFVKQEEINNLNRIIDLLQSYLKLNESFKMATLLDSKTVRPDKTSSPSAQRPISKKSTDYPIDFSHNENVHRSMTQDIKQKNMSELEEIEQRLRVLLTSTNSAGTLIPKNISRNTIEDKALMKQIYYALKKQQLHRLLSNHSNLSNTRKPMKHSVSLTNLSLFNNLKDMKKSHNLFHGNTTPTKNYLSESKSKNETEILENSSLNKQQQQKQQPPTKLQIKKHYNSCGTQTNFIPLQEIKRLAEDYKIQKREEELNSPPGTSTATDDEDNSSHRRKSSIDNEDVSQSVSDTIKRYLRMARKKSVHDDNPNRFKRVNYDRNLRNIKAKGEINPPGIDEDNDKATQTLDAWPLITLEFIRGNENSYILDTAHADWQKALEQRIQKKQEYERKLKCSQAAATNVRNDCTLADRQQTQQQQSHKQSASSCSSSSAPTSPTTPTSDTKTTSTNNFNGSGILHTSTQFLTNLWHGSSTTLTNTNQQNNENSSTVKTQNFLNITQNQNNQTKSTMQKSKSSSNVGNFVSRKILRSRSKSQTRPTAQVPSSKWTPTEKLKWISDSGDQLILKDTSLTDLFDVEAKILQRVAIEKINEFNININVKLDNLDNKTQKRRVLPKKKAITTSIFDIAKKDEKATSFNLFGSSLENCLENDKRLGLIESSRLSLDSDFRDFPINSKLSGNVRSCESLPFSTSSSSSTTQSDNTNKNASKSTSSYFSNFTKLSSKQISRSQSDVRRKSHEFDLLVDSKKISPTDETVSNFNESVYEERVLQVPSFVLTCIKYLEQYGLSKIGLFRVSTSKKRVNQMREDINKNFLTIFPPETCPHDVATLLKEFLRDLPEPLICHNLQSSFLETQKIRNRRLQLEAISHLIKLLPTTHRDTLFVLLRFLATLATFSDDTVQSDGSISIPGNKMNTNNLATIFAPNILTPIDSTNKPQDSVNEAINVIRTMIDHYEELFKVSAELLDVVYSNMLELLPEQLFVLCDQRSKLNRSLTSNDLGANQNIDNSIKFYSRQSLMHDNDASKFADLNYNGSNNALNKDCTDHKSLQLNKIENDGDRRQSSPNDFHNSAVVSGSLQIQMPLATVNFKDSHDNFGKTNSMNIEKDCLKIPFIEDSPDGLDVENSNECFPITGSFSFSTKNQYAPKVDSTSYVYNENTSIQKKDETNSFGNEPNLPASISNIGGAILRSKTADFERKTNRKSSSKDNAAIQGPLLYKRQQIIPSAKHIKNTY